MTKKFIVKRDGRKLPFDKQRIESAIGKALGETSESIEWGKYEKMINDICDSVESGMSVELINDLVEIFLMSNGLFATAKAFVLYRAERAFEREASTSGKKGQLLTEEFISKYKHLTPPMTQLGELVYYRTYSRYLPEKKRREYWWETVRRAVEYNCSLAPTSRVEAEQLFDNIFHLRQFISGRTLFIGGTPVATKYAMSNYNCSYQTIDEYESFRDIFYVLLIGSGAGLRVLPEDVKKLPPIRTDVEVIHQAYHPIAKPLRHENTSLEFSRGDTVKIIVGDSKDGWVDALDYLFKIQVSNSYRNIGRIIFVYDHVRPLGEPLRTFGGTASGHQALQTVFEKIDRVVKKKNHSKMAKLEPVDGLDIANIIGEGVVVGGVRRTSEVVLFGQKDKAVLDAKSSLYTQTSGVWSINQEIIHRQMSNNSVFYKSKPSREEWSEQIRKMRYSGEPGFVNEETASKRRPNFNGVNP
jgi:ribonucleoside-triphosphate reductase